MEDLQVGADYKPICRTAVIALIVGLLGLLSLLSPVLLALPAAGVILSLTAMSTIRKSSQPMVGRGMARFGLHLSLFCLAAFAGQTWLHRTLLTRQARQHSGQWLTAIAEDRLPEAHQMTLSQGDREAAGANLAWRYRQLPPEELQGDPFGDDVYPYQALKATFLSHESGPLVRRLQESGQFRFVRVLAVGYEEHLQTVELLYELPDGATFLVSMRRNIDRKTRETHWQANGLKFWPEPPA